MQRHHPHRAFVRHDGRFAAEVQCRQRVDERIPIGDLAAALVLAQQREEAFRRLDIDGLFQCRRPPQRHPGAPHAARKRRPAARGQCRRQHRGQPDKPAVAVDAEAGDRIRFQHRGEERPRRRDGDGVQVGQGEAAPRGAQHGEPREPVRGLGQRVGERRKIADRRALGQRLQLDGGVGDTRRAQRGQDGDEVRPCPHQYRDFAGAARGAARTEAVTARASASTSATNSIRTPGTGNGGCCGNAGANATCPRHGSLRAPSTVGNTALTHSTRPRCARKFRRSTSRVTAMSPIVPLACASRKSRTSAARKR